MLTALSPTAALRADIERGHWDDPAARPDEHGDDLAAWTLVATMLRRLDELPADARAEHAVRAGRALGARRRAPETGTPARPATLALARALERWGAEGGRVPAEALIGAARDVVEDMERAGALSLARTSLVALLGAAAAAGPAAHGVTLAHLGRVVRQMGELDAALTLYDAAAALAATAADDVLAARAAVGSGVIYGQRGNFPAARAAYKRALALAPARSPIAAGAHHGLMLAALAAGDLEDALGHAWRAFADAGDDADRRSEALCNLGGLCRRTGEHDAALHAFRAGLALTTNPRLRLGTLRNAALSAAQTGRRDLVVTFARETDAEIARVGQPYEVAQALLDLGESYRLVGDREEAAARLDTSRDLAAMHGFHEIVWRAETARAALGTARPAFDQPREAFAVWGGTAGGSARTVVQQVRGLPLVASELLALR